MFLIQKNQLKCKFWFETHTEKKLLHLALVIITNGEYSNLLCYLIWGPSNTRNSSQYGHTSEIKASAPHHKIYSLIYVAVTECDLWGLAKGGVDVWLFPLTPPRKHCLHLSVYGKTELWAGLCTISYIYVWHLYLQIISCIYDCNF